MTTSIQAADRTYPEKVLSIYHAVIHFFCTGRDLSTVKITDIAQAAGIGKGTVYEYFSSKEELIVKALLYAMEIVFRKISTITREESSFKKRMYRVMEYLLENDYERIALLRAMTSPASRDLTEALSREKERMEGLREIWSEMARKLLSDAVEEGVIQQPPNAFYWQMVLHGALSGLISAHSTFSFNMGELSNNEIMDNVYRMIMKALN